MLYKYYITVIEVVGGVIEALYNSFGLRRENLGVSEGFLMELHKCYIIGCVSYRSVI